MDRDDPQDLLKDIIERLSGNEARFARILDPYYSSCMQNSARSQVKARCGTFVTYSYHVQDGIPARYISLYTRYEVWGNPSDFPCIVCTALADDRGSITY